MRILGAAKGVLLILGKHKSALMAGSAVVTAIGTVVLAVKATVKSVKDVEDYKEEKYVSLNEDIDNDVDKEDVEVKWTELVKTTWKNYIPVAIGVAVTTTLIICAHRVDAKKIAAATSALMLSDKMNKELENKTIEEFGKEKFDEIRKKIFHENDDLRKSYLDDDAKIIKEMSYSGYTKPAYQKYTTGERHCWFRDSATGQEVWASKNQILTAINTAVRNALQCGHNTIALNDWLDLIDGEPSSMGYVWGWDLNVHDFNITYEPDIAKNGEPCLIMKYYSDPIHI